MRQTTDAEECTNSGKAPSPPLPPPVAGTKNVDAKSPGADGPSLSPEHRTRTDSTTDDTEGRVGEDVSKTLSTVLADTTSYPTLSATQQQPAVEQSMTSFDSIWQAQDPNLWNTELFEEEDDDA